MLLLLIFQLEVGMLRCKAAVVSQNGYKAKYIFSLSCIPQCKAGVVQVCTYLAAKGRVLTR